ncbi:MAG: HEAT repeat domain-containing protein [Chloroflexi bacterium]|nr:HEAT repeat domain-containing protein [Chloroflexota bacterium]
MLTLPLPDSVKEKIWNGVASFLAEQAKKVAGEEMSRRIEGLRSDRAFAGDLDKAIERAATRFATEYEDQKVAHTLTDDAGFYYLPNVQNAVQALIASPYNTQSRDAIEADFVSVLSPRDKVRARPAAEFFLARLREELISVHKAHDTLELFLQLESYKVGQKQLVVQTEIRDALKPSPAAIAEARVRYLDYLIETNKYTDPRGIMQTRRSVTLKLDEIFVLLTAEAHDNPGADIRAESARAAEDEDEEENTLWEAQQRLRPNELRTEPVDLSLVLREHPRVAILGGPGAGKTTLMRFLALHFARAMQTVAESESAPFRPAAPPVRDHDGNDYGEARLPILLRVAVYADAFTKDRALSLREFLPTAFGSVDAPTEALGEVLYNALRNGRALVLLDGLDEIIEAGDRVEITRRIEEFAAGLHPHNRFVVTSRIAGYRSAPLGGGFAHFTLRELARPQIEKFLNRWCPAVERFHTPTAADAEVARRAQIEIDGIVKAVDKNEGVKRLAANPLMLTVLALIHHAGAHLPSRRVELYELAVKTLLEDWELARGIPSGKVVKENEARRMLGPLAHWLHASKSRGEASEGEVKDQLAQALGTWRGLPPDHQDVETAVDEFLQRVREHTGIFVERAPKVYGFMHLTFEEYFAARELVRRRDQTARRIYERRHQPRWEEPIRLAISFLSDDYPDDASDLIRTAILAEGEDATVQGYEPSRYEDILHRDLLLAGRCMGDCVGVDAALRQRVVRQLLMIYFDRQGAGAYEPLRRRIIGHLRDIQGTEAGEDALRGFLSALNHESEDLRGDAAEALGQLGNTIPEVPTALLTALNDKNERVRRNAVMALGRIGHATPEVLIALLTALNDEHEGVRGNAVLALMWLGNTTPAVLTALLTALNDKNEGVRGNAVGALGRLGNATPEVLAALLTALNDKSKGVRGNAAQALGRLGNATPEVLAALLTALNDADEDVRRSAALALGRSGDATPEVLTALVTALNDKSKGVRGNTVVALGRSGDATPEVLAALLTALKDKNGGVRGNAAQALGRIGHATPEVLIALLTALNDDKEYVRGNALVTLGWLGNATPEVLAALLTALNDKNGGVRGNAAQALGRLGNATPEVLAALLTALNDKSKGVRGNAATALGRLRNATPEVLAALLTALNDENEYVRGNAAEALEQLCNGPAVRRIRAQLHKIGESLHAFAADPRNRLRSLAISDQARYAAWDALWAVAQAMDEA